MDSVDEKRGNGVSRRFVKRSDYWTDVRLYNFKKKSLSSRHEPGYCVHVRGSQRDSWAVAIF